MKFVSLQEFLTLPEETLFFKIDDVMGEQLCLKKATTGVHSFFYSPLDSYGIEHGSSDDLREITTEMEQTGKSVPMDFTQLFHDKSLPEDQLFAVYERHDIEKLVELLKAPFPF